MSPFYFYIGSGDSPYAPAPVRLDPSRLVAVQGERTSLVAAAAAASQNEIDDGQTIENLVHNLLVKKRLEL